MDKKKQTTNFLPPEITAQPPKSEGTPSSTVYYSVKLSIRTNMLNNALCYRPANKHRLSYVGNVASMRPVKYLLETGVGIYGVNQTLLSPQWTNRFKRKKSLTIALQPKYHSAWM